MNIMNGLVTVQLRSLKLVLLMFWLLGAEEPQGLEGRTTALEAAVAEADVSPKPFTCQQTLIQSQLAQEVFRS
jgi:hypothetical protein